MLRAAVFNGQFLMSLPRLMRLAPADIDREQFSAAGGTHAWLPERREGRLGR